jgi:hypothetical protein
MTFLPHRKQSVSITKTNRLTLFGEIIIDYYENLTKHINAVGNGEFSIVMKVR